MADIVATVSFFPTEAGGRSGPTPGPGPIRFMPIMVIDGENFIVLFHLEEVGCIYPGQTVRVPLSFLSPALVRKHCSLGKPFTIREIETIASGVIDEINFDS